MWIAGWLACTGAGRTAEPAPAIESAAAPADGWQDVPTTHLGLALHRSPQPSAHYALWSLSSLSVTEQHEVPAWPVPQFQSRTRSAAAAYGGRLATARARGGSFEVLVSGAPERVVDLGSREPAALHLVGDTLLVGTGPEVGVVSLEQEAPTYRQLVHREALTGKAYDLFARHGGWVIAIDDMQVPFYADTLRLDAEGEARAESAYSLPSIINGTYVEAVLAASGPDEGILYAIAPYYVRDGMGRELAMLPLRDGEPVFEEGFTLNGAFADHPLRREEHSSHDGTVVRTTTPGSTSEWTGLAWRPGQVLLAAVERGLLVLEEPVVPTSEAAVVELGAPCRDVVVVGDRVWALVGDEQSAALVALEGDVLTEVARYPLPLPYDRFL